VSDPKRYIVVDTDYYSDGSSITPSDNEHYHIFRDIKDYNVAQAICHLMNEIEELKAKKGRGS